MNRFLVVGGDGFIGAELAKYLEDDRSVVYRTTRRADAKERSIAVDLSAFDLHSEAMQQLGDLLRGGPLTAFITAAVTGFKKCEADPVSSRLINVENTCLLAEQMFAHRAFVVFLSSNTIFSGEHSPLNEDCAPDPRTEYGRQKAEAESRLLHMQTLAPEGAGLAVVRLTKVLSAEQPLIREWIHVLRNGGHIKAANDLKVAPISLRFAVLALTRIAQSRKSGIFHLSGIQSMSYYRLATCLARLLGVPKDRVQPTAIASQLGSIPSPALTTLDMPRTSQIIGVGPQSMDALLRDLLEVGRS